MSDRRFIIIYLLGVGCVIGFWWMLPKWAFVLFLSISAYHFGQSQLSHYFTKHRIVNRVLSWFWGLTILVGLILFNEQELAAMAANHFEFNRIHIESSLFLWIFFFVSLLVTVGLLVFLTYTHKLKRDYLIMELFILMLLLCTFFLLPFLVGFTLYFIVLHAIKVMNEEYHFLKNVGRISHFRGFLRLLSPFSFLSFIGIGGMLLITKLGWFDVSFGYLLLVLVSAITIPHAFVMDHFYALLFRKKFYEMNTIVH
jgi:Brp/Blh family beta-carotene 15,15'-monooxygenase